MGIFALPGRYPQKGRGMWKRAKWEKINVENMANLNILERICTFSLFGKDKEDGEVRK